MKSRARDRQRAGDVNLKHGSSLGSGKIARTEADANVVPLRPDPEASRVRSDISKTTGLSPRTAQDALTIWDKGTEFDWQAVKQNEASISGNAREGA